MGRGKEKTKLEKEKKDALQIDRNCCWWCRKLTWENALVAATPTARSTVGVARQRRRQTNQQHGRNDGSRQTKQQH